MPSKLVVAAVLMAGAVCMPTRAEETSAAAGQPRASAAASCNRRCLLRVLTEYTEALTDNNVSRLNTAPGVRATSNGVPTTIGKGEVWGPGRRLPYRQAFVDPVSGAAIFYGAVTNTVNPARPGGRADEGAGPPHWWFYVVRLKIEAGHISEVEEVSYEKPAGGFGAEASALQLPDRVYDTVLPLDERSTREQLFEVVNKYFDAVSHKIDGHDVPWHPECQRIELGVFTVNAERMPGSCGGEFQTPSVKWNVSNRRLYVADVERGVAVAIANFMTPPEYPNNNGSVVVETFKIQDGLIRQLHAFFRGNGQKKSGWGEGAGS